MSEKDIKFIIRRVQHLSERIYDICVLNILLNFYNLYCLSLAEVDLFVDLARSQTFYFLNVIDCERSFAQHCLVFIKVFSLTR